MSAQNAAREQKQLQRIKAIDKEHFAKLDKMHSTQVMEAQKV